jgi:Flp pilus assembly protein TadG
MSHLKRAVGDTSGSVSIIFALSCTVLILGIVMSVDYARAVMVSQKLAVALDAAALAGAKLLDADGATDAAVQERAQNFFQNEIERLGAGRVQLSTMSPHVDRSSSSVTTTVDAKVKTYFGGFAGIPEINLRKTATVVYKMRKIELAMALDVTGSMSDVPPSDTRTKIESLQSSAKSLVAALFARSVNDSNIRIALAPYSSGINAGTFASYVTGGTLASGCVVERDGTNNATDAVASGGDALRVMVDTTYCPVPSVMPLNGKSKQSDINTEINSFTASGGTAGHLGTAWAWYMLTPSWSSVFGSSHAPAAYSQDVIKSVVIMTDGLFNTSYVSGYPGISASPVTESYTQFQNLCAAMKAKGVVVYTVLFGLVDATAESNLKTCASATGNYFTAANGTQLQASFTEIADRLNSLRLTR